MKATKDGLVVFKVRITSGKPSKINEGAIWGRVESRQSSPFLDITFFSSAFLRLSVLFLLFFPPDNANTHRPHR